MVKIVKKGSKYVVEGRSKKISIQEAAYYLASWDEKFHEPCACPDLIAVYRISHDKFSIWDKLQTKESLLADRMEKIDILVSKKSLDEDERKKLKNQYIQLSQQMDALEHIEHLAREEYDLANIKSLKFKKKVFRDITGIEYNSCMKLICAFPEQSEEEFEKWSKKAQCLMSNRSLNSMKTFEENEFDRDRYYTSYELDHKCIGIPYSKSKKCEEMEKKLKESKSSLKGHSNSSRKSTSPNKSIKSNASSVKSISKKIK